MTIHEYGTPKRVKAGIWYLRHRVAATLPAGLWEFKREGYASVAARYTPRK